MKFVQCSNDELYFLMVKFIMEVALYMRKVEKMAIVLGIDTGGTYTDGIVINVETKEIMATTKANTTHHDLMIGIRNCINQLEYDHMEQIDYVSLSTTLATNAIVEGRGSRVGLLLLGVEPVKELPHCEYVVLPGGCDLRGDIIEELDLEKTKEAINAIREKWMPLRFPVISAFAIPSRKKR